jgi:hypothetical protein
MESLTGKSLVSLKLENRNHSAYSWVQGMSFIFEYLGKCEYSVFTTLTSATMWVILIGKTDRKNIYSTVPLKGETMGDFNT